MSLESFCDVAAGVAMVLVGGWLIAQRRLPVALCSIATGVAWLAGSVAGPLALVHRLPLAVALLVPPLWAAHRAPRSAKAAVAFAVGTVAVSLWWPSIEMSFVLAVVITFAAVSIRDVMPNGRGHAVSSAGYGLLLGVVACLRLAGAPAAAISVLYACGVTAVLLSIGSGVTRTSRRLVVDLLAAPHTDALEWRLREALGDPSLRLILDGAGAVGHTGASTPIRFEGRAVGTVVHADHVQLDPRVAAGLGAVAALNLRALALRREASRALDDTERIEQVLATVREREALTLAGHVDDGPQRELARAADLVTDDALLELIDSARRELSLVAAGLAPQRMTQGGLRAALEACAAVSPVPVSLVLDDSVWLDRHRTFGVLSICTEALANSAKHAGASRIGLEVRSLGNLIEVEVWDDGVGVMAGGAPAAEGGYGLHGMQMIAEDIGATLNVTGRAGGGTCVLLRVPTSEPPP